MLLLFTMTTMKGTVDQIDRGKVFVEIEAKDGHVHATELPQWIFPCLVNEGTVFYMYTDKDTLVVKCDK